MEHLYKSQVCICPKMVKNQASVINYFHFVSRACNLSCLHSFYQTLFYYLMSFYFTGIYTLLSKSIAGPKIIDSRLWSALGDLCFVLFFYKSWDKHYSKFISMCCACFWTFMTFLFTQSYNTNIKVNSFRSCTLFTLSYTMSRQIWNNTLDTICWY